MYCCKNCCKEFKHDWHLQRHLRRKRPCGGGPPTGGGVLFEPPPQADKISAEDRNTADNVRRNSRLELRVDPVIYFLPVSAKLQFA